MSACEPASRNLTVRYLLSIRGELQYLVGGIHKTDTFTSNIIKTMNRIHNYIFITIRYVFYNYIFIIIILYCMYIIFTVIVQPELISTVLVYLCIDYTQFECSYLLFISNEEINYTLLQTVIKLQLKVLYNKYGCLILSNIFITNHHIYTDAQSGH